MADVQIHDDSTVDAPKQYVVPSSASFLLKTVVATFDGSSAAGAFLPCVEIISDSGELVARGLAASVAAGSEAEVSFFPFNRAAAASSGGSGIQFDTSPQSGDWLYVETTESSGHGPGGYGIELKDDGPSGILLTSDNGQLSIGHPFTGTQLRDSSGYGIDINNVGGSGQLTVEGSSSGGIFLKDTYGIPSGAGIELETDATPITVAPANWLNLTSNGASTQGVKITAVGASPEGMTLQVLTERLSLFQDLTEILRVDASTSPATYHIQTGASWVADL